MSHYNANDLKTMLAGAQTLQSMSGDQNAGILARTQAELGVESPKMAAPAPEMAAQAAWKPVLGGPEV
jgi:UDP-N-acetylmuramyl pentapeptide synthase